MIFISYYMDPHLLEQTQELERLVEDTKNTILGAFLSAFMIALPYIILL